MRLVDVTHQLNVYTIIQFTRNTDLCDLSVSLQIEHLDQPSQFTIQLIHLLDPPSQASCTVLIQLESTSYLHVLVCGLIHPESG